MGGKAHKKQMSNNLDRGLPSSLAIRQLATPKSTVYPKASQASSKRRRKQKSIGKVSSDLIYNLDASGLGTAHGKKRSRNFFDKIFADQREFERKLKEDKALLREKEARKVEVFRDDETKSQDERENEGLVRKIQEELQSERGHKLKEILRKFIDEPREDCARPENSQSGTSRLGRKIFNFDSCQESPTEGLRPRKQKDTRLGDSGESHENGDGRGAAQRFELSEAEGENSRFGDNGTKRRTIEIDFSNLSLNEKTQILGDSLPNAEEPEDPGQSRDVLPLLQRQGPAGRAPGERAFRANAGRRIIVEGGVVTRGENELPNVQDFNTDETTKILQNMCFKKPEQLGSEAESKEDSKLTNQPRPARGGSPGPEMGESPVRAKKEIRGSEQKSEELGSDEELFRQKPHRQSTEKPSRSSKEFFFGKKLISDREVVQDSVKSIQKGLARVSASREDSGFPFSNKFIESTKKISLEGSQRNAQSSMRNADAEGLFEKKAVAQESDSIAFFERKIKDDLSLSMEQSDRLISKNSFKCLQPKGLGLSEQDLSNFHSLTGQSNPAVCNDFGIAREMQLTREKKMNAQTGDKSLTMALSSRQSFFPSNMELGFNKREINIEGIEIYGDPKSSRAGSKKAASGRHLWGDSFKDSRRNLSQAHIVKASNDFLFETEMAEGRPVHNPREICLPRLSEPFKNLPEQDKGRAALGGNRELPRVDLDSAGKGSGLELSVHSNEDGLLQGGSDRSGKKKSITTVKNYKNLVSSKVYSSPDPQNRRGLPESSRVSTFKEMPGAETVQSGEPAPVDEAQAKQVEDQAKQIKAQLKKCVRLEKKISDQDNDILELKTKNSNLTSLLEQQKQEIRQREKRLQNTGRESRRKEKRLAKMNGILKNFRGRLTEMAKQQGQTLKLVPENFSFIERQNREFVKKMFSYEKQLVAKMKDLGELEERVRKVERERAEQTHVNINLQDKIQVHVNKTATQQKEILELRDKNKNYQRIVENLGHDINNLEMKLARKSRKYRSEIARARKCGKCSQRSMRKIKGRGSEVVMSDLNQIKEESLSNYSETDSDDQEVNLNDYQEVLDSRNEIQGRFNALMAKYMDCRNMRNKYQMKYKLLMDRNIKAKHKRR